ncbi:hypothetical protein [Winogradskyella psychrotolerans]|uniref:hypothetical protein n=1 Tax=Winogradskyella psychrotolerans TaxID=1344585 RepID=UPI001C07108C|nr:hypothetical protein [Winogradskyella psychrotolerans]MBU2928690.1 hypothetical protein [Winogradskyella psychrotolerans]
MKHALKISLLILTLISCKNESKSKLNKIDSELKADNVELNFQAYIKTLDKIKLPIKYSLSESKFSKKFSKIGFEKYKHVWTSKPYGILYENDNNVVLADLSIGDGGLVPFITSFDLYGNKIDSLGPYKKSGMDIGYEAIEFLTFNNNRKITVIDSIRKWKLNNDGTDIMENSLKITSDTIIYRIKENGKIITE